jgi:hypothetical protein
MNDMVRDAAAQKTVGEEIRRVYGHFSQIFKYLAKVSVVEQKREKTSIKRRTRTEKKE